MTVFKCKMCGGALDIKENETVAVCEYCGTKQTLPKLDDEKRANLYDRANHFRRNNEFDKAMGIYEQILNEDNTDAEAYWSIVLCRYGIEYVEDGATHKRIPTVNRAQFTSIFDDDNYKQAIQHADGYQKEVYEEEAKVINEIQKGILAISQKEEPFDVFICYKETDNAGRRTQDSVLANDLYHQLTQEGFKVFFSRITLEDKLGSAYEPYIFAALNSSKVMVVIGTKPEHFNAVWVKNEWSRYLALIKNGGKKMLIPAYRDMDPYDLPEEFSHLQAQDMSKLGFMQDLIRGIKKIAADDKPQTTVKETVVVSGGAGGGNIDSLLKRAFMFLEDEEWEDADEYCEKVLDQNPECAEAYLGKLMAEVKAPTKESLRDCEEPFDDSDNYRKVVRFGDEGLQNTLAEYLEHIRERNEQARLAGIYAEAMVPLNYGESYMADEDYSAAAEAFGKAAEIFATIPEYKDAAEKEKDCLEKADRCNKDAGYYKAVKFMEKDNLTGYEKALAEFQYIKGWRDVDEQIENCRRRIEEIKIIKERVAAKRKVKIKIGAVAAVVVVAFVILLNTVILPPMRYNAQFDLAGVSVGDEVKFGYYEQSGNNDEIEWQVLAVENGKALLISKYGLDCQPYNTEYEDVTWETCTLRKWLNKDFYDAAFDEKHQKRIEKTTVITNEYDNPVNDTKDNVFLLSINEAEKYFSSDEERQCQATAYAKEQGAGEYNGNCWFWLRSPGDCGNYAACVGHDGGVGSSGRSVNYDRNAVRPALWVNLES